jgi:pimeloyl-ACP methyl ester carboxylesterase
MVADTRAAVQAVASLEEVDASRISLMGYSLGGKVAIWTAAVEPKVASIAVIAGFDPLRLSTADRGVEGVAHYSHLHGLLPRLGFFVGREARLPVDSDEVLSLVAPRPALVIAPRWDRYARLADVETELEACRRVWDWEGKSSGLTVETPPDINRFPVAMQNRAIEFLVAR